MVTDDTWLKKGKHGIMMEKELEAELEGGHYEIHEGE